MNNVVPNRERYNTFMGYGTVQHFLSMDFKSGFWQIKMAPELQQYTAFKVGNLRFYNFTCMPFRLCNALATFQHLMQNTLGEMNLMYCDLPG